MPDILGRPRSMMPRSNGTSRPMYRPSSPSWAASTAKPSRFRRADRVSRSGASSSTSSMRMGAPSAVRPSVAGLFSLVAVVVVVACTPAAGLVFLGLVLTHLRIVPVHPHPAAIIDDLDPVEVPAVVLHALGAQHLAPRGAFGTTDGVRQRTL